MISINIQTSIGYSIQSAQTLNHSLVSLKPEVKLSKPVTDLKQTISICSHIPYVKACWYGYYRINIGNGAKPCSTQEIHNVRKLWLSSTPDANYRVYPCYEDINDKSTLQFWIIHY